MHCAGTGFLIVLLFVYIHDTLYPELLSHSCRYTLLADAVRASLASVDMNGIPCILRRGLAYRAL